MHKLAKEFVAAEHRSRTSVQGNMIASALAGFIAGAAVASIIFLTGIAFSLYFFQ